MWVGDQLIYISCFIRVLECLWTACVSAHDVMHCIQRGEQCACVNTASASLLHCNIGHILFKDSQRHVQIQNQGFKVPFYQTGKVSSYLLTSFSCSLSAAICSIGRMLGGWIRRSNQGRYHEQADRLIQTAIQR